MASRIFSPAMRAVASPVTALRAARSFQTSSRRLADAVAPLPVRKPVGAFRGGLFGFLLGSTLAGTGVYYYILEEYKVSNELLTEDIYSLQASVQRVHTYVQTLEEKIDELNKKKK
ncbi:hypothetical protein NA56DRAFT_630783 [Hyaloscypha hepaticicola]|uniref:Uncharacterized protein n=1 Tax=Hyaloscypha hepaticicola TaxID=2082293 RepID=A0A2J6PVA8_9HELO|nr:hypothetical protein NA56DRAFT_630783 [Hyaloscypha hepaticicola]